jgi:hypothetical protein
MDIYTEGVHSAIFIRPDAGFASALLKLPGRFKVGQPGTVTGGKRR